MAEKRHIVSALHCLTRDVVNKKCYRNSSVHIIKSGLGPHQGESRGVHATGAPTESVHGITTQQPTKQPAEHKYRTDKPTRAAVIGILCPAHSRRSCGQSQSRAQRRFSKKGQRLVLRAFQPCTARTKRDESPVMYTENGARR